MLQQSSLHLPIHIQRTVVNHGLGRGPTWDISVQQSTDNEAGLPEGKVDHRTSMNVLSGSPHELSLRCSPGEKKYTGVEASCWDTGILKFYDTIMDFWDAQVTSPYGLFSHHNDSSLQCHFYEDQSTWPTSFVKVPSKLMYAMVPRHCFMWL